MCSSNIFGNQLAAAAGWLLALPDAGKNRGTTKSFLKSLTHDPGNSLHCGQGYSAGSLHVSAWLRSRQNWLVCLLLLVLYRCASPCHGKMFL